MLLEVMRSASVLVISAESALDIIPLRPTACSAHTNFRFVIRKPRAMSRPYFLPQNRHVPVASSAVHGRVCRAWQNVPCRKELRTAQSSRDSKGNRARKIWSDAGYERRGKSG